MKSGIVEIDLHEMNQHQARVMIDSRLKKAGKDIYRIRIVHGYRSGTALRDMIRKTYKNHPKVIRVELSMNPGITELVLREL